MKNFSRRLRSLLFKSLCLFFFLGGYTHAVFFPGETLSPNCAPDDPNCQVDIYRIGDAQPYKFFDADNSHFVGLQAPSIVGANTVLILPPDAGSAGQFLVTDGSGNLSWGTGSGVLPSQSGHAGKYLQTDGTNAQWVSVIGGGGGTASGIAGALQFSDGSTFTSDENELFWDNALKNLGLGTSSPQYKLDVQGDVRITDASLLIENAGQYVGFRSPAGMTGDSLYTLPSALPTGGSKILQANTAGELSWVDPSASSGSGMGVFVGKTATPSTGNFSSGAKSGYPAGNDLCDQAFAGSHLCTQTEMMFSISQLDISTLGAWTGAAWTSTGGAKYSPAPIPVNDCNGFTHGTTDTYLGSFWMFSQTTGGAGGVGHCANNLPLACCQ